MGPNQKRACVRDWPEERTSKIILWKIFSWQFSLDKLPDTQFFSGLFFGNSSLLAVTVLMHLIDLADSAQRTAFLVSGSSETAHALDHVADPGRSARCNGHSGQGTLVGRDP